MVVEVVDIDVVAEVVEVVEVVVEVGRCTEEEEYEHLDWK